jgi:hypothetical protein
VAVLLHEFGHCFGARLVEGDAQEVVIWPLGGLANVEVPHTPRANFITTLAGPLVNLFLCVLCVLPYFWFTDFALRPTWNPLWNAFRHDADGAVYLYTWAGQAVPVLPSLVLVLARFFWLNWVLFWLNMLLIGFPMDGGRLFQCALWPKYGYRQATMYAVISGFIFAFGLLLLSLIINDAFIIFLAFFIYYSCRQQWIILETGGEEQLFGYDFSQGYTSLERDQPPPPRRKQPNFFQRWMQKRAQRKLQREQETREAEERRMDELLEKVQRDGLQSLTDEERRFLTRVSARYRNRH